MFGHTAIGFLVGLATLGVATAAAGGLAGEPFFPRAGNAGYQVSRYDAHLSYDPASGKLRAAVSIAATSSRRLPRFSLDLDGLRVVEVTVDGQPAEFSRGRGKLKITPTVPVSAGSSFLTLVRYSGRPRKVIDPDGSTEGWYRTPDGAVAVGEPLGTAAWLPCDNVPTDKAVFDLDVTVPKSFKAVANGRLTGVTPRGRAKTFHWRESEPMSTYLALIDIGHGRLAYSKVDGLPSWTLVDPGLERASRRPLAKLGEIIRFESSIYGPYPFDAVGSVVDAAKLGYALETQTRPIYAFAPDLTTVVHETAHQWFGDSVGLDRWPNIWLNEGFATWTEWYYAERHGGRGAAQIFRKLYRVPASNHKFWDPPPGNPGNPEALFATSTYVRGGMALEALRLEVGTAKMLKTLRRWATEHRYGNADVKQFIALAEEVSGRSLGGFFHRWLFAAGKPAGYGSL